MECVIHFLFLSWLFDVRREGLASRRIGGLATQGVFETTAVRIKGSVTVASAAASTLDSRVRWISARCQHGALTLVGVVIAVGGFFQL